MSAYYNNQMTNGMEPQPGTPEYFALQQQKLRSTINSAWDQHMPPQPAPQPNYIRAVSFVAPGVVAPPQPAPQPPVATQTPPVVATPNSPTLMEFKGR
jgi:hypothetical protein